jgi:hypothetical protein
VKSGVTIKRTKEKLPNILEGINGPLLRTVASIDGYTEVFRTTPQLYTSLQKTSGFKYNKKKYYWLLDGYLFIPNVEWDAVQIDGIFEGSLSGLTCDDECEPVQKQLLNIPSDLYAQIEQQVVNDFLRTSQTNPDPAVADKQSPLRA